MTTLWHEVPIEEQQRVLVTSGLTIGQFMMQYVQPEWCGYPEALNGTMGCWSLLNPGRVVSRSSCKTCEFCQSEVQP